MLEILIWFMTVALMLGGLVGVVLPLVPGTTLILFAAVLHKLLLPAGLAWHAVGLIGGLWLISIIADFAGVVIGARCFGGSKWGMAGAGGGALIGAFISLPALLLGTMLGAVAAEKLIGQKTDREALKSGLGAASGFVFATVTRLACAMGMIACFAIAVFSRIEG